MRLARREKAGRKRVRARVEYTPVEGSLHADVLDAVFGARFVTLHADYAEKLVLEVLRFAFGALGAGIK